MVELRLQHEQERTHVLQQHNAEKDSLVQEHQREIQSLEEQARAAMTQYERSAQEWRKRDGQVGDRGGTSALFRVLDGNNVSITYFSFLFDDFKN